MLDILLTPSHDLDTSPLDLVLVEGADRIRQQLRVKLMLWKGEWFLDTEFGTPYLQSVLGKQLTLSGALAAIRTSVLEVAEVSKVLPLTYTFDNKTRKLTVAFKVITPYGTLEIIQ
jgi:hypothetical protein